MIWDQEAIWDWHTNQVTVTFHVLSEVALTPTPPSSNLLTGGWLQSLPNKIRQRTASGAIKNRRYASPNLPHLFPSPFFSLIFQYISIEFNRFNYHLSWHILTHPDISRRIWVLWNCLRSSPKACWLLATIITPVVSLSSRLPRLPCSAWLA